MYIFELRLSIHILQKSWTKNHQYSQYSFELYQTVTNSSFYILLKLLNTWLSQFCAITNQLIFELAYMIGINLSLWLNLSHRKLLTTFALLFVNKNSFYFFFSSCDMEQDLKFLLHVILLFKSIIPGHRSNINSFIIIIVKNIIIKINIINVYTIKAYITAAECNNIRTYITKNYTII